MGDQLKISPYDEAVSFSSPLISMSQFKEQWISVVGREMSCTVSSSSTVKREPDDVDDLAKQLGVDNETISELTEVCSIDNLKCEYDERFDYKKSKVYMDYPEDNNLHTVRMVKIGRTKNENLTYVPSFTEPPDEEFTDEDVDFINDDDVILNAIIFHPKKMKQMQQILLLESTKLSELRDLIVCRMDSFVFGEFSNNPDLTGAKEAKDIHPASFFFVESCFYNDTRNPLSRDYSKIIIDWAKSPDRLTVPGLGLFQSKIMQDTSLGDLTVRLGFPYLFCHQGFCEHLVVFTDMRMRLETDPKLRSSYPYKAVENTTRRRKCSICYIHLAKWMTLNDELAFEDPGFFCEKCYRYLHYAPDGRKLSSFEAYPYIEED